MVNSQESDKARGYIQQLDEARCASKWADVPELCRKVDKHAPHRKCLTLTARSEAQIAAHATQRPSTATSAASAQPNTLSSLIPQLLTAIEEQGDAGQDSFQATVCLGWLHYVLEEPGLAVARLPKDLSAAASSFSGDGASLGSWTKVCLVKAAYLKGAAQEKTGAISDAVMTYSSIMPWLTSSPVATESKQSRMWTENLVVRLSQLSDQSRSVNDNITATDALRTYRYWAKFSEATGKSTGSDSPGAAKYSRMAWKAYYDTLSTILRHNLPYEPEENLITTEKAPIHDHAHLRLRQRAELKRVETVYETLVLKETRFPKASESNREIEAWVDSVIDNWRLLCGATWTDEDLGEGGKEGVGRGVLDILYRAATKTFHSTQVLRYLFIVHASLAEFDLAFKAYDSYVEIITRGKDRAEKSGEEDVGIDDDSTVLRTSAEAIRILCRFGARKEAEKALEIGHSIERWLEQSEHIHATSDAGSIASADTQVEPLALAVAYSAIGVSQAQWSRFTYETEKRGGLQAKAIQYLRKSLSPGLGDSSNVDALYALALVLAETRDIAAAIKVVKRALSPAAKKTADISTDGVLSDRHASEYGRERKLIPIWHLLALLLTARSDFDAAEKACEAAFEQFGDPTILFGSSDANAFRSEHLNQANTKGTNSQGIVDRMETFEKTSVLHVKMTQLALLETTDGATAAVDGCDELLALYNRLFGDPASEKSMLEPPPTNLVPPKSAVGTIRGSIFRGRGSVKSQQDQAVRNSSVRSSKASTAATNPAAAPEIQVTQDDATTTTTHHHHHILPHHHKHEENQGNIGRSPSKLQKRSSASLHRQSMSDADQTPEVPPLPENIPNGTQAQSPVSNSSNTRKSSETSDRPLRTIPHNMAQTSPPLDSEQPPKQDIRLPAPFPRANYIPPDPRFSKLQARRQKVSLLIDIWIFISGLYLRAQMFHDAREAVGEAHKLAETFEAEVSLESSTAKALADQGWGGGKSVEELWGSAFAARGELLLAQSLKHEARVDFERALLHFPDHPQAMVGLSNILLDIYNQTIPLEPASSPAILTPTPSSSPSTSPLPQQQSASTPATSSATTNPTPNPNPPNLKSHTPSAENRLSPPELNRLAARDRAFGLLSTLTKLGSGWDYSEAWCALARAYEESEQLEKTKEVLWWCVELEDSRPLRGWDVLGLGGFIL